MTLNTINTENDDEALARALQDEYISEFFRANNRLPAESQAPYRPSAPRGSPPPLSVLSDAELARRLAAEEEALQAQRLRQQQQIDVNACRSDGTGRTSPRSSCSNISDDDVALARRIEQELQDEEIARQLTQQEQTIVSQQHAQQMATQKSTAGGCTFSDFILIFVIVAAAGGLVYYFVYRGYHIPLSMSSPNFANEDPFHQLNPKDANRWETNNHMHGLSMQILNALQDNWYPYFDLAVSQWDNGNPDALTLTTAIVAADSACSPIEGKIKVCNGNYGDTQWLGINEVLLTNGYITSSAAKMNEYYLMGYSCPSLQQDQMQYTMCHEIGHGFGLPHTDENPYNKDLGNCLDYTIHPGVNKQPALMNFQFLANLYGTINGGSWNGTNITASTDPPSAAAGNATQTNGNGRLRRTQTLAQSSHIQEEEHGDVPAWVWQEWKRVVPQIEQNTHDPTEWKVLHRTIGGEAHERCLGMGYTIQIHKLFILPEQKIPGS